MESVGVWDRGIFRDKNKDIRYVIGGQVKHVAKFQKVSRISYLLVWFCVPTLKFNCAFRHVL
jgi:hypothetical protein